MLGYTSPSPTHPDLYALQQDPPSFSFPMNLEGMILCGRSAKMRATSPGSKMNLKVVYLGYFCFAKDRVGQQDLAARASGLEPSHIPLAEGGQARSGGHDGHEPVESQSSREGSS